MEVTLEQFNSDILTAQTIFGTQSEYSAAIFGNKNLRVNDAVSKAFEFCSTKSDKETEFFLIGNTGVGKTMACCCVLNRLSEVIQHTSNIATGLFIRASELATILKYKHMSDYKDIILNLRCKKVVMIDDITMIDSKLIDEFYLNLTELLSSRQEYKRITLMTSNMSIEEYESLPKALLSRLSKAFKAEITGEDLRNKQVVSGSSIQVKEAKAPESFNYKGLTEDIKQQCLVAMYFTGLSLEYPDTNISYEMAESWKVDLNQLIPEAEPVSNQFTKAKNRFKNKIKCNLNWQKVLTN